MTTATSPVIHKNTFVPKVLSERMIWRIKAVNRALRELKSIGYTPIDYDLEDDLHGTRVQVKFMGSSIMKRLKDRSLRYEYDLSRGEEKRCYVFFDDITVWWREQQ